MIHLLFLFHRYLGIAVGALMAMWCTSGVVMMYVSYPDLQETSRRHHLAPIVWSSCCKISAEVLADDDSVDEFQVEMLAGRPVLQLRSGQNYRLIDLVAGSVIDRVSTQQAVEVAMAFAEEALPAAPRLLGLIDYDQWTVSGSFSADRPLYHFSMGDEMGTELYVSSTTGHAVQITTVRERFWNWLGSVPHWLYFAELRRSASLWSQIVIMTSLTGCFLTATGIYIGVRQLAHRPTGRWSPYCGFNLWHHAAGLFFGVFALTWILSGLLSMNPWGWLEGAGSQPERAQLFGKPEPSGAQFRAALAAVVRLHPIDVVSLDIAPLDGRLYLIASTAGGERQRLSADAVPTPLNDIELTHAAGVLGGAGAAPVVSLMTREDSYYFSHHHDVARLPVYRMILGDGTRYYIDAVSGGLVAKIDRNAEAYRWLHKALHRMDFAAPVRGRPQWDALMLILMSGVTVLCVTGAYLGYRRLVRS